jgi:hypothetical protein
MMYYIMHRTQIMLDEWQYEKLKAAAEREGRSISSLVRDAVSAFLDGGRGRRGPATSLSDIAGIGDDPGTSGREHDRVLYGPRRGSR